MFPNIDIRNPNYHCGVPPVKLEACAGFEVAVDNNKSVWAKCAPPVHAGTMGSGFVFVDCGVAATSNITSVRYGYADWALLYLYNRGGLGPGADGLPADPFVTDVPAQ